MDPADRISSIGSELSKKACMENPSFANFTPQQQQLKWENTSVANYGIRLDAPFVKLNPPSEAQSSHPRDPIHETKTPVLQDDQINSILQSNRIEEWDPRTMLSNLSFLEQKIHQLQSLVHLIVGRRSQVLGRPDELVAQQQQLVTADLTSIIVQLISTAGSLLPSMKHTLSTSAPSVGLGRLSGVLLPPGVGSSGGTPMQHDIGNKVSDISNQMDHTANCGPEQNCSIEEHEMKDEEDVDDGETLSPGSCEILQLEKEEILAPHTHFCTICGKGFKRDANLRMHMRGHGDEYKTPAALAKPNKESSSEPILIKRYSCPFAGCKRNKDHKKFQPLKTILCVKNHYKRTHCDKSYTCSRCNTKKFSVIADLKTHEKHCGKDKWLCSCGTTFSRKDKLFGHIALFQGHTPAIPPDENKGQVSSCDKMDDNSATSFGFGTSITNASGVRSIMDIKGTTDDSTICFSPLNFDTCNFGGFHEFPRLPFDDSESSFSFLLSGSCNYNHETGRESGSNNLH